MSKELPKYENPPAPPFPPGVKYRIREYMGDFTVEKKYTTGGKDYWIPVSHDGYTPADRPKCLRDTNKATAHFNHIQRAEIFVEKLRRGVVYHEV